jgi:chromosome segregation ATPase
MIRLLLCSSFPSFNEDFFLHGQDALAALESNVEDRDHLAETLRSRCKNLEETLSSSVLNLQEKESQNRSLSSTLIESRSQLEQQVEAANAERQRTGQILMQTEQCLESFKVENEELTEKCKRLESQLHNLSDILIESQQRWEREIVEEKERQAVVDSRCADVQHELSHALNSVKSVESECQMYREKADDAANSLMLASSKEVALIEEIKALEEKLVKLESVEKHQLPQMVAKCKNLEAHTQQLSEILIESQKRWENEIAAVNLKSSSLERQLSEAQQAYRVLDAVAKESGREAQTLTSKINELEQVIKQLDEKEAINQRQIQDQEEHVTKLLLIEKKRLDTIHNQRAALKDAEQSSVLLKNEVRDLKTHLDLLQARDVSLVSNLDRLKSIGQEREAAMTKGLQSEIERVREELKSASAKIEQLSKENSTLKAEVCGFKQERAPWPNAISGFKAKAEKRNATFSCTGPLREADRLRMQLDAVEKLAAERTEQVPSARREKRFARRVDLMSLDR